MDVLLKVLLLYEYELQKRGELSKDANVKIL